MEARDLIKQMQSQGLTIREGTLAERVDDCIEGVKLCIRPRTISDRTCMRKIRNWLLSRCESGVFSADELLPRIIDHALEASRPECRNPRAVFMSLIKKELKYAA